MLVGKWIGMVALNFLFVNHSIQNMDLENRRLVSAFRIACKLKIFQQPVMLHRTIERNGEDLFSFSEVPDSSSTEEVKKHGLKIFFKPASSAIYKKTYQRSSFITNAKPNLHSEEFSKAAFAALTSTKGLNFKYLPFMVSVYKLRHGYCVNFARLPESPGAFMTVNLDEHLRSMSVLKGL